MSRRALPDKVTVAVCIVLLTILSGVSLCAPQNLYVAEDPDTGNSAAVWLNQPQGQSTANVLYSYLEGSSWSASITLSSVGRPGVAAVLAFDASGGRSVAFATAETIDRVLVRTLPSTSGSWESPVTVSATSETSTRPWIVCSSSNRYISFEVVPSTGGRTVKVAQIDPGGNVERSTVVTTSSTSALNSRIYSEGGRLWIDWVESAGQVGYSEYVNGAWSTPSYEGYDLDEGPDGARDRVRAYVLGP